jgi:uncharacterized lipoprotein YbaY
MKSSLILLSFCLLTLLSGCQSTEVQKPLRVVKAEISGVITYPKEILLPDDALVNITLNDVTEEAKSPVAKHRVYTNGVALPLSYILSYYHSNIDPKHDYQVHATVEVKGVPVYTAVSRAIRRNEWTSSFVTNLVLERAR